MRTAAAPPPQGSPLPRLPPYPSPRESRPRPAAAHVFFFECEDYPNRHFPVVKTMLIGRALKHRGVTAALSEAVFVSVYRIVAHMVAQLMDVYSRNQIKHLQFRMEVERNWMFV